VTLDPAATILVVDDDPGILRAARRILRESYEVIICASGPEALAVLEKRTVAVLLTDHYMPGMSGLDLLQEIATRFPASLMRRVVLSGRADAELLEGYLNECRIDHFTQKPFTSQDLRRVVAEAVEAHRLAEEEARKARGLVEKNATLADENRALRERLRRVQLFEGLVGVSDALREVLYRIDQVRQTDVTIHITGETGTGKELVARALHDGGLRAGKPMVAQNCAGLNGALLQSMLFGYRKGAFTGADQDRDGLFQQADGGTLFLDEVGELPATAQASLLRALQDGEIVPVGATRPLAVDVRLISATHVDLKERVEAGTFREDLYYRLVVIQLDVPPLRERTGDVTVLARHFLERYADKHGKSHGGLSPELLSRLERYDWPGNVRELGNEIERLVVLAEAGTQIGAELLSSRIRGQEDRFDATQDGFFVPHGLGYDDAREQLARWMVTRALQESGGVIRAAAAALAMERSRLAKLRRRLGIRAE